MKKLFKFIASSICIVTVAFGIFKITNNKNINIIHDQIDWEIEYQGIENARSFVIDEEGYIYIAFSNYIKIIDNDSKEEKIIRNSELNIYDIEIYKGKLIIATDNRVLEYDKTNNTFNDILTNIPNEGINKETKLLVKDDELFISIGSNTNSGIVESGNEKKDIASFQWILTGENYGYEDTGAFLDYGISSTRGQTIENEKFSNASIMCYNFITQDIITYATGIRSVEGFDFDENGTLISIVSGIENIGLRPISDDKDYIYEIKEKHWYGWPDFSGGDPISSPRFSDGENLVNNLIENQPTYTPYGPLYQHSDISALKGLSIDKKGQHLEDGTIIFADNNKKYIYKLNNNISTVLIELKNDSYIEKIKCYDDGIYILDSGVGELYVFKTQNTTTMNLPNIIWIFIIIFMLIIIMISILKFKNKEYNKR